MFSTFHTDTSNENQKNNHCVYNAFTSLCIHNTRFTNSFAKSDELHYAVK